MWSINSEHSVQIARYHGFPARLQSPLILLLIPSWSCNIDSSLPLHSELVSRTVLPLFFTESSDPSMGTTLAFDRGNLRNAWARNPSETAAPMQPARYRSQLTDYPTGRSFLGESAQFSRTSLIPTCCPDRTTPVLCALGIADLVWQSAWTALRLTARCLPISLRTGRLMSMKSHSARWLEPKRYVFE